jgi:hypothetical protein
LTQKEEPIYRKTEATKNYDEIGKQVRKLIAATAATYIKKLCEALRKDWYPGITDEGFRGDKDIQDDIRDKVLNDYARERNEDTNDYGWAESTILRYFPTWLKNPKAQEGTEIGRAAIALKRYEQKIDQSFRNFDRLEKTLPDAPRLTQEVEEDPLVSYSGTGTIYEPPEKYVPTPEDLYEDIIHGYANAWYALTNKNHIPGINEDVLLDYIKPSEKHRLRILKGIDEAKVTHLINMMTWSHMLIKRTIEMWNEIQKEKRTVTR